MFENIVFSVEYKDRVMRKLYSFTEFMHIAHHLTLEEADLICIFKIKMKDLNKNLLM